jgi:hypothetical protein
MGRAMLAHLAPRARISEGDHDGAEFFGIEWTDRTAMALICTNCGYVHEFLGGSLELYDV